MENNEEKKIEEIKEDSPERTPSESVKGKTKTQSIGKGFVILSAATVAVKLMSLIFVPVMSALLGGDEGYAAFGATNEVFAFIYVIATAGIPVAVSKLVTELTAVEDPVARERAFKVAKRVTAIVGAFFTALMIALARPLSLWIGYEETWAGLMCIAPTIFICAILSVYRGYFQGRKNMTPTALSQVAEQIVHVCFSIAAVAILKKLGFGLVEAVAGASLGTAAGAFVALIIVYIFYRRSGRAIRDEIVAAKDRILEPVTTKSIVRKIFYYGIPITLSSGIQYGGNMIDVAILKNRLVYGGIEEGIAKGMYGSLIKARQLINVPTALVTALCVSILPAIAGAFALKDTKKAAENANYGFKLCFMAAVPIAGAFTVFSKQIYEILRFDTNNLILTAMAMSILITGVVHLQSSVLNSVNKLFNATLHLAIGIALKAVLNYFLVAIPALNIYGAIISTYVSFLVPLILNAILIRRTLGRDFRFVREAKAPIVCTLAMLAGAFAIYFGISRLLGLIMGTSFSYIQALISFAPAALFGLWFYVFLMGAMGGLTREDVSSVSPKLVKFMPKTVRSKK